MDRTNAERAQSAETVLVIHQTDLCHGHREQAEVEINHGGTGCVSDLLTDLRHWCDAKGINFGDADRLAYMHYAEEKGDERAAEAARLALFEPLLPEAPKKIKGHVIFDPKTGKTSRPPRKPKAKKARASSAHTCGDECRSNGCRIADGREVSRG